MSHLMCGSRFSLLVLVLTLLPAAAALAQPASPNGLAHAISSKPIAIEAADSEELKLLKERHNAVAEELQLVLAAIEAGLENYELAFDCMVRLGKSKLELAKNASERIETCEQILKTCQMIEKLAADQLAGGRGSRTGLARAKYQRVDAELNLLRAKKELPKPAGPAKSR